MAIFHQFWQLPFFKTKILNWLGEVDTFTCASFDFIVKIVNMLNINGALFLRA